LFWFFALAFLSSVHSVGFPSFDEYDLTKRQEVLEALACFETIYENIEYTEEDFVQELFYCFFLSFGYLVYKTKGLTVPNLLLSDDQQEAAADAKKVFEMCLRHAHDSDYFNVVQDEDTGLFISKQLRDRFTKVKDFLKPELDSSSGMKVHVYLANDRDNPGTQVVVKAFKGIKQYSYGKRAQHEIEMTEAAVDTTSPYTNEVIDSKFIGSSAYVVTKYPKHLGFDLDTLLECFPHRGVKYEKYLEGEETMTPEVLIKALLYKVFKGLASLRKKKVGMHGVVKRGVHHGDVKLANGCVETKSDLKAVAKEADDLLEILDKKIKSDGLDDEAIKKELRRIDKIVLKKIKLTGRFYWIDYEGTKYLADDEKIIDTGEGLFTKYHKAPEFGSNHERYTTKTDDYGAAIMAAYLARGEADDGRPRWLEKGHRPIPKDLDEILDMLIRAQHGKRKSVEDALDHKWFDNCLKEANEQGIFPSEQTEIDEQEERQKARDAREAAKKKETVSADAGVDSVEGGEGIGALQDKADEKKGAVVCRRGARQKNKNQKKSDERPSRKKKDPNAKSNDVLSPLIKSNLKGNHVFRSPDGDDKEEPAEDSRLSPQSPRRISMPTKQSPTKKGRNTKAAAAVLEHIPEDDEVSGADAAPENEEVALDVLATIPEIEEARK